MYFILSLRQFPKYNDPLFQLIHFFIVKNSQTHIQLSLLPCPTIDSIQIFATFSHWTIRTQQNQIKTQNFL